MRLGASGRSRVRLTPGRRKTYSTRATPGSAQRELLGTRLRGGEGLYRLVESREDLRGFARDRPSVAGRRCGLRRAGASVCRSRRESTTRAMAPKKKGKKGKTKATPIVDGLAPEDMSKEQVEEHVSRVREELDREREERNYFQLERDKIHTFWEITRRQLEEKKAELRNKDREMEEAEERHQVEIKVYKQKVKHLLYEHQNNLTEMKAEGAVVMKLAQREHCAQEGALRKDMRALKVELKEQELANEVVVKNLRLKHSEEVTKMRNDFERQVREIEAKYDKKMKMLRDELDLRRKTEIHEVEERKNGQINMLMQRHEEAFTDIKNYYNDITLNNLALINSLKEQLEDMRKKEGHLEREMMEVSAQNKRLTDPLQKARDDVTEMQKKLGNYERDRQTLVRTKARLKVAEKELKDLQWEHEVLEQRFLKVQQERDELYRKFTAAILEVQQKVGFKNLVLERKLQALSAAVEKKEVQINEVLAASNLDPAALTLVSRKLENVLESKNNAIKDLQYELARVCKAHSDLLRTYEAKLLAFGIPLDNVGFKPLETAVIGQTLGQGPAGLVGTPT
ncbi:dynein regulatory complex subunit 4 isoform X1 [Herpailurus yagouaroundi]|uniref:dynein regulatory complex subunit 4 isoform X1 n=2 Tax=Herpailurus yagouaroundi TaxID=1608482 RepID=UPI001AD77A1B|nr:dynein regulatory complex subunit 4 isoform X1 [Puma yagouaroundi]XP_040299329.1 dynein regulatory complex subunit 4 isoform X1 [Puma yagouaroundi]